MTKPKIAINQIVLASLVIVALLVGGWFVNYALASHAVSTATNNSVTITQLCQSGNEFRAQQRQLWSFLIHISPPPPNETAAQRIARVHLTNQFLAYVDKVNAPRNCTK